MASVSMVIMSRFIYNNGFPRVGNTMFVIRHPTYCLNRTFDMHERGFKNVAKKKEHKFPQENGVTRLEELSKKLNPPPSKRHVEKELPSDSGFKVDSTGQIFSSYVPVKKKRAGDFWIAFKANVRSLYSIAIFKRKLKPFNTVEVAQSAQRKFIDLNNFLQQPPSLPTELRMKENATLLVVDALKAQFQDPAKKIYWRFVKELERPRIVNAQIVSIGNKENLYGQITVKICSEQILAIRDRYDRLITGSLKKSKRVTDFVVFEKQISDPYSKWRICGKLNG